MALLSSGTQKNNQREQIHTDIITTDIYTSTTRIMSLHYLGSVIRLSRANTREIIQPPTPPNLFCRPNNLVRFKKHWNSQLGAYRSI